MSLYENYDAIAAHYDAGRRPIALEHLDAIVRERCIQVARPLRVLDAGCGTGNYAHALLERHSDSIERLIGVDASEGMLSVARSKLSLHGDKVELRRANLLERLPFEVGQFDVVICSQVIHHLSLSEPWPAVSLLLSELRRVLDGDGRLCIIWTALEQRHFWYRHYFPRDALAKHDSRFPTSAWMRKQLAAIGFRSVRLHACRDAFFTIKPSEERAAVFDRKRRNSVSWWSTLNEEELAETLAKISADMKSGEFDQVVARCQEAIERDGMLTVVDAS